MKKDYRSKIKKSFSITMILMLLIMSMPVISIADSTLAVTASNVTETTADLSIINQTSGSTIDVTWSPADGGYDSGVLSGLSPGTTYNVTATETITSSVEKEYVVYLDADLTLYYNDDNNNKVRVRWNDCYYYSYYGEKRSGVNLNLFGTTYTSAMVSTTITNIANTSFNTVAVPVPDGSSLTLTAMGIEPENKDTQTKWRIVNNFGEDLDFTWQVYGTSLTGSGTVAKEHTMDARFDNPYYVYVDAPHQATLVITWGSSNQFTTQKSSTSDVLYPEITSSSLGLTGVPVEGKNAGQTKWRVVNDYGYPLEFTWKVYGTDLTGTMTIPAEHTSAERFNNPFYFYAPKTPATMIITWGNNNEFNKTKQSNNEVLPYPDKNSLVLTSMPTESSKADAQTKWRVINKYGQPITFTYTVAGHPEITGTHTIGAEYTEADRFDNPFYFYIDLPHAVTAKILWGDNNEFSTTKASSGEVLAEEDTTEADSTEDQTNPPAPTEPNTQAPAPAAPQGPQGTVVVNFVDTEGAPLAASLSFTGTVGTLYQTSARSIADYELVESPANASGSFIDGSLTVDYVYSNGVTLVEEETPLGEAVTPFNFDAIYDNMESTTEAASDEAIILDEETPLADALPQTGQASPELFYGIGSIVSALGIYLKRKIK